MHWRDTKWYDAATFTWKLLSLLTLVSCEISTIPQIDTDTSLSCTFAMGTCAWTDSESSSFIWEVTEATGTGSGADPPGPAPTTDNLDDHVRYLFVSGNDLEDGGLYAALESPFFTFTGPSTLSFWHRKSSKEASVLGIVVYNEVYAPSNNSHIEIAVPNGQWTKKTIDLDTRNTVQIAFNAILMAANESAALDEIRWSGDTAGPLVIILPTEPPTMSPPLPVTTSVTCDFDSPVIPQCRWNSDPIGIEWSHSDGSLVGGEVDGVSGSSPFLYADSTDAGPGQLFVRLVSPVVSRRGGVKTQLTFRFRLDGPGVTDVKVALESRGLIKNIFHVAGQSWEWVHGIVDICVEHDFQVVFEVGFSMAGCVIAIDDVVLVNETTNTMAVPLAESCGKSGWGIKTTLAPPSPTSGSVGTTPASTSASQPTCLTWNAVDDASCNFNLGICSGWIFPDGNLLFFQASRPTGIAPYIVPGPQQGDGYAVTACSLYTGLPNSGISVLRSPPIKVPQCEILYGRVSFWYVFANVEGGNRMRHLQLDMKTRENRTTLWTATDQPSTFWRYAQVTFISQVDVELEFAAEHADCSVPTALDSIVTERGNASEPCDIVKPTNCSPLEAYTTVTQPTVTTTPTPTAATVIFPEPWTGTPAIIATSGIDIPTSTAHPNRRPSTFPHAPATDTVATTVGFNVPIENTTQAFTAVTDSLFDMCQSSGVIVTCAKGKVTFSDPYFNSTDELVAVLEVDNTLRCRSTMYSAQSWLLAKQGNLARHYVQPVHAACRRGLVWVSDTKPDESEATRLTFETTGNLQCRELFVKFLQYISSL